MAAAVEPRPSAAASRRPRRGRGAFSWLGRIAAFAVVLAVAVTAILAFSTPYLHDLSVSYVAANHPLPPPPFLVHPKSIFGAANSSSASSSSPIPVVPPVNRNLDSIRRKRGGSDVNPRRSGREVPYWRMKPEEALRRAKKEIRDAPVVSNDTELDYRVFHNVSVFKRSYELMEKILKVYVYQDGSSPIFHTPELQGIYASEGWFMKLMEESRDFTTRDAGRAHLFYLPYSLRRLKEVLYIPDSHNMKPISAFIRDYVNNISSEYPYWNRSGGADHFIVACHDWGSYTTTLHEGLCKNAIKALCNADTSEGIFVRGKDVSLPETTIKVPRKPLRYVGGRPVSQRFILAFYAGNMHGRVRPILRQHWGDGRDDDMRIYARLPRRVSKNMSYVQHMQASRFCICPMGYEVNSPRLVEAIYAECVPVIIADNFVLPLEEVLDWSAFAVVVAEKDIPDLKSILLGISQRRYMRMQTCVRMVQRHFLWHAKPVKYDIFHMILHSIWFTRLNQIQQLDE